MRIEVLKSRGPSGRKGGRAHLGRGLAKLHFDNGEAVIVRLPGAPDEPEGKEADDPPVSGRRPILAIEERVLDLEDLTNYKPGGGYPLISLGELPHLLDGLGRGKGFPRFAVLMFVPANSVDGEHLNLQYSVERGAVGLDWVLLGGRNIEDRETVRDFARWRGHEPRECEMNGVGYLRVEGPGLAELGMAVMHELYGFGPGSRVQLLVEGFDWPANA